MPPRDLLSLLRAQRSSEHRQATAAAMPWLHSKARAHPHVAFFVCRQDYRHRLRHPVAEALSARGVPFVYSTGNTGHGSRDGYSDRPVLRNPFKFEELVAILTRFKIAPVE
jgi:hypothetical protein